MNLKIILENIKTVNKIRVYLKENFENRDQIEKKRNATTWDGHVSSTMNQNVSHGGHASTGSTWEPRKQFACLGNPMACAHSHAHEWSRSIPLLGYWKVHTSSIERPKSISLLSAIGWLRRHHADPDGSPRSREGNYLNASSTKILTLAARLLAKEEEEEE